jgi:hypothetical protein
MVAKDYEIESQSLNIELNSRDFKELTGPEADALFKIAAQKQIEKE